MVHGVKYDGLTVEQLSAQISVPQVVMYETVTSTLDVLHGLAEEGAPHGTLVLANQQIAGRGRRGKGWHSPPGAGIWLARLIRKEKKVRDGILPLRVGMALAHAVDRLGIRAKVKWPNDIMVDNRKVAGVLCEARSAGDVTLWVAVGVGINVHGPVPEQVAQSAVALDEVVTTVTRIRILHEFMKTFDMMPDHPDLSSEELVRFEEFDWLRGKTLLQPGAGIAEGVDKTGSLLVRGTRQVTGYRSGHVVLA